MIKRITGCVTVIFVTLLAPTILRAQGIITFLSNVGKTPNGSLAVGSNSWFAMSFTTGNNISGYGLDSVQLEMVDAFGAPNSFNLMVYSAVRNIIDFSPGNSLGTLNGSGDPSASGTYVYTPVSSLLLSSNTTYFLVLTAGTSVANDAYGWSLSSGNYSPVGAWRAPASGLHPDTYASIDGLNWTPTSMNPQFAINATPIPEPGVLSLLAAGSLGLHWHRRQRKAV